VTECMLVTAKEAWITKWGERPDVSGRCGHRNSSWSRRPRMRRPLSAEGPTRRPKPSQPRPLEP